MSTDISSLKELDGFIGACLVDSDTGLMLAAETGKVRFDLEAAGAANTEVMRAKARAMQALGLKDRIEDILIMQDSHIHLIRPLSTNPSVFLYVAVDRTHANPAVARSKVKNVEATLAL